MIGFKKAGGLAAVAVKANGYGHGLPQMVKILKKTAVSHLALHSTSEAENQRQ